MRKSTTIAVGVFLGACFASLALTAPLAALAQGSNTTTDSNQQKHSHHHSHQGNKGGAASGAQQGQQ
jgi:Ca2+/Na+ antiporter